MNSLNLLPEERKKSIVFIARLHQWRTAASIAVIGALLAAGATGAMDWMLASGVKTSEQKLQSWQELSAKRQSGQVTTITREINQTVIGLDALLGPLSQSRDSMEQLLLALPPGIRVSEAKFLVDGSFTLTGVAASRSSFLALRTALDDSPAVSTVSTTSTANQRENLPFEYTGQLTLQP